MSPGTCPDMNKTLNEEKNASLPIEQKLTDLESLGLEILIDAYSLGLCKGKGILKSSLPNTWGKPFDFQFVFRKSDLGASLDLRPNLEIFIYALIVARKKVRNHFKTSKVPQTF